MGDHGRFQGQAALDPGQLVRGGGLPVAEDFDHADAGEHVVHLVIGHVHAGSESEIEKEGMNVDAFALIRQAKREVEIHGSKGIVIHAHCLDVDIVTPGPDKGQSLFPESGPAKGRHQL